MTETSSSGRRPGDGGPVGGGVWAGGLPEESSRVFRLLSVHPGARFGLEAVAALTALEIPYARRELDLLSGAGMLRRVTYGRYAFPESLREQAAEEAAERESAQERAAALRRVLDWYLHTADAARGVIEPGERPVALDPPSQGSAPLAFDDYDKAVDWYETEHANVVDAARAAESHGLDGIAWQLPAVVRGIHMGFQPFREWLVMGRTGLDAARRSGDRPAEAELLEGLGVVCLRSYRLTEAADHHDAALAIRRELGDRPGEALSLLNIGLVRLRGRQLARAAESFERAGEIAGELGAQGPAAQALLGLGQVRCELRQLEPSLADATRALEMCRAAGDRGGEGGALHLLGTVQCESGEPGQALRSAEAAVEIAEEQRNRLRQGDWVLGLGRAQLADGQPEEALISYHRAASLHRRLGDRSGEAQAWNGAGDAFQALGRPDEASAFHRTAAMAHRALGDAWRLAVSLDGLATALSAENEEEADRHRSEAAHLLEPFDDPAARELAARVGRSAEGEG